MATQGLPRLFGLPWEQRANGPSALGLVPFVAVGSPLTKTLGQTVTVNWAVRNDGTATGYVLLTLMTQAGTHVANRGPVGILAGSQVTLSVSWTPPEGSYVLGIVLEEYDQGGTYVRPIADDAASLSVVSVQVPAPAPPTEARLVAVGSPTIS
jgi:hypothetical protein